MHSTGYAFCTYLWLSNEMLQLDLLIGGRVVNIVLSVRLSSVTSSISRLVSARSHGMDWLIWIGLAS